MAHEDEVMKVMEALKIADKHTVGAIVGPRVGWQGKVSSVNQAYKALSNLVDLGRVEKHRGYFRMAGCRSEYGEHAQLLTHALAEILIKFPESVVFRECFIEVVGLRPDAVCLLRQNGRGFCLVLEIVHHETEEYLKSKMNVWRDWQGGTEYLSHLFNCKIPHVEVIALRKGETLCAKLPPS